MYILFYTTAKLNHKLIAFNVRFALKLYLKNDTSFIYFLNWKKQIVYYLFSGITKSRATERNEKYTRPRRSAATSTC